MDSSRNDMIDDEENFTFAIQLAAGTVLPMVLRSAIELDLFELIKTAGSASATELAAQLPTQNPQAGSMIDRILRLLAAHSVLKARLPEGSDERRYSLAPVCKFFTTNQDGASLAPMSLFNQDKVLMESWYHLKDAVLQGGVAFDRAHGMNAFEYAATDPRFSTTLNKSMHERSIISMKKLVEIYKGFEGLKTLVDVGGGTGAALQIIMSKYPHIKGINFDLPHVAQNAPPYPGMEHVGGNMFVSVPKADAIFMKTVCHDWDDAHCEKLLKNCYESLPDNGKVIVVDFIVPEDQNNSVAVPPAFLADVMMMAVSPYGKERTEKEFQALAKQAGFTKVVKVCSAFNFWIQEFHK